MRTYLNELSGYSEARSEYDASMMVESIVEIFQSMVLLGFREIGLPVERQDLMLFPEYSLADWLANSKGPNSRRIKDILLGAIRVPATNHDPNLTRHFEYTIHRISEGDAEEHLNKEAKGLGIASLAGRPAISFKGHRIWENPSITLERESLEGSEPVVALNISMHNHLTVHEQFLSTLSDPELIKTNIPWTSKRISLADHHGKNELESFAKKILRSSYAIEVVCSLEMNSSEKRFIRKINPDGTLDIVLTWTERGLAFKLRTTGRNYRETEEIAKILSSQFQQ